MADSIDRRVAEPSVLTASNAIPFYNFMLTKMQIHYNYYISQDFERSGVSNHSRIIILVGQGLFISRVVLNLWLIYSKTVLAYKSNLNSLWLN